MTDNERIDAINALLKKREDVASLMSAAMLKATEIRRKFAEEVDHLPDEFPCGAIALFRKGEYTAKLSDDASPKIKHCLTSTSNVSIDRWATASRSQIEQDLWTLWINNQMVSDGSSRNERMLSECFDVLARRQSSLVCLMRWLFPETKERLDVIDDVAKHSWPVRDRMLFWIACMRDMDCSQEKVRWITAQILRLQLSSGAFGGPNGNLAASACGLLALISCARENGSENTLAIDAVRQAARWIVGNIAKANDGASQSVAWSHCESVAWAYYALCEYINLESTTKWR